MAEHIYYDGPDIYIPADEIPESSIVPADIYVVSIDELVISKTRLQEGKKQKLMVTPYLVIVRGATTEDTYAGVALQHGPFVLGTENDPNAEDPRTWKEPMAQTPPAYGIIRYGNFLRAAQIGAGRLKAHQEQLKKRQVLVTVGSSKDTNEQSPFYGQERNTFSHYQRLGSGTGGPLHNLEHRVQPLQQMKEYMPPGIPQGRPQPEQRAPYMPPGVQQRNGEEVSEEDILHVDGASAPVEQVETRRKR